MCVSSHMGASACSLPMGVWETDGLPGTFPGLKKLFYCFYSSLNVSTISLKNETQSVIFCFNTLGDPSILFVCTSLCVLTGCSSCKRSCQIRTITMTTSTVLVASSWRETTRGTLRPPRLQPSCCPQRPVRPSSSQSGTTSCPRPMRPLSSTLGYR